MTKTMTSDQRKVIRTIMRRYMERCETYKGRIHYSQVRPFSSLGDPPSQGFTSDCSGYAISAFYWADLWLPYKVKDPGGYGYTGIGNTGTILTTNKTRRVPLDHKFFVGDMALFGPWSDTKHVTVCRRNGGTQDSIWSSLGSELGPYGTRLQYRDDLLCVVRSEALA
jgi:hypothetical protein